MELDKIGCNIIESSRIITPNRSSVFKNVFRKNYSNLVRIKFTFKKNTSRIFYKNVFKNSIFEASIFSTEKNPNTFLLTEILIWIIVLIDSIVSVRRRKKGKYNLYIIHIWKHERNKRIIKILIRIFLDQTTTGATIENS